MDKKDFLKEKYIKEKALELFPECYSRSLKVITYYSDTALKRLNEYIVDYFENGVFNSDSSKYDASKVSDISDAYFLVKKEYNREKDVNLKYNTYELFEAYGSLLSNIWDYHFIAHRKNSYGENQNKSNKQILLEISMLYPVLLDTLEKIERYYDDKDCNLFTDEIDEKISYWTHLFVTVDCDLEEAKDNYHNALIYYNRGSYFAHGFEPQFSLGEYKKNWKLRRNEACHTIYEFYQDIMKINKAIDYESFDVDETSYSLEVSEIEELYNYAMENIVTGPNYYCYLSGLEREEDRNVNVLKKAITKM